MGDGMTRWVDGQFALNRPELGLSNWEHGRLLARGGVLSGDSVFTIRMRMRQADMTLRRDLPYSSAAASTGPMRSSSLILAD